MKRIASSKKINYIAVIIFFAVLLIVIYFLYSSFVKPEFYYNNMEFKNYSASSPYADVTFRGNDRIMYVNVKYKNLSNVSAIHIHADNNGSPGPILAWLGTTEDWQRGVKQTTKNSNAPCCSKNNPKCLLASPDHIGTPYLSTLMENSEKTFVFRNDSKSPGKCPWIKHGAMLVVHGFNFQQNINGKLTSGKPGLDIILKSVFNVQQ
uniref:CHRD domain-containing protein n=1 Tax=viral metagenome TaxID=1070528 RepID=A0A6C0B9I6_9ZZZZ